jgi:predicted nucleic acid-binding protein
MCDVIGARCQQGRLLRVQPDLIGEALDVMQEHGLTAYDAAYVAAARRKGWTLVSIDIADLVSKGLAVAPDAAV